MRSRPDEQTYGGGAYHLLRCCMAMHVWPRTRADASPPVLGPMDGPPDEEKIVASGVSGMTRYVI